MSNHEGAKSSPAIEVAVQHHRAGRLFEAETIYRQVLEKDPSDLAVIHLLGFVALQRGRAQEAIDLISQSLAGQPDNYQALNHLGEAYCALQYTDEAVTCFERALDLKPDYYPAHNNLGNAYRALARLDAALACYQKSIEINPEYAEAHNNLGIIFQTLDQLDDAIRCFQIAIEAKPDWGGAHFNLGLALKRKRDLCGAAKAFTIGWLRDPAYLDSAGQCVATIADLARTIAVRPAPLHAPAPRRRSVSVVFCSIDDVKCARTVALYDLVLSDVPHQILAIRDACSLAEAYNRALQKCQGDIVVLSHDDIEILAPDFAMRLEQHLQRFDVIGVVGSTTMRGPMWKCSGHPNLRGWITHRVGHAGNYVVGVLHPSSVARDIATLDGVFLAARREVFAVTTFDDKTFDGFHLYDIDWSYRAAQAGFRVGVTGDLLVVHDSRGNFSGAWNEYADRFCRKHQTELRMVGPSMIFEAEMDSSFQVRQFFTQLGQMARVPNES